MTTPGIRVLVADDHRIMLDGICAMLNTQPDIVVVAQARTGRDAVAMAIEESPDLTIMDISMPLVNGIEATRQIRAHCPNARILCLSMHADRRFIKAALEAGASGYLLKDCGFKELMAAVRTVAGGQIYLCTTAATAANAPNDDEL